MRLKALRTDPTYKEWKQVINLDDLEWYRSTDPTYKEWKPRQAPQLSVLWLLHGSYLQGMETLLKFMAQVERLRRTDPTYKEWKLALL